MFKKNSPFHSPVKRVYREVGAGLAAVPGSPDLDSYRAALAAGLGPMVQDGSGLSSGSRMEE